MEKITESKFGKFEGCHINNLSKINGGAAIKTGAGCDPYVCVTFQSDKLNDDGSYTYYKVKGGNC